MCCFCGESVAKGEGVAVIADLHAGEDDDTGWQQWWAHPRCFGIIIHPDARHFRDELQEAIDNDKVSHFQEGGEL